MGRILCSIYGRNTVGEHWAESVFAFTAEIMQEKLGKSPVLHYGINTAGKNGRSPVLHVRENDCRKNMGGVAFCIYLGMIAGTNRVFLFCICGTNAERIGLSLVNGRNTAGTNWAESCF